MCLAALGVPHCSSVLELICVCHVSKGGSNSAVLCSLHNWAITHSFNANVIEFACSRVRYYMTKIKFISIWDIVVGAIQYNVPHITLNKVNRNSKKGPIVGYKRDKKGSIGIRNSKCVIFLSLICNNLERNLLTQVQILFVYIYAFITTLCFLFVEMVANFW